MIVWPGLRRSVSAISRLFNSASFFAPLTHSAIPTRAASGTTATFTRATTATVTNNDGYLVTALSGEARFEGARRIRNLIAGSSEDLANASWSSILVTAPTPTTVLATAGAGAHHRFNAGPAAVAGNTYVLQAKLTAGTARYAVLGDRGDAVYRSVTFDLQTGTKGAEHNATGTMEDLGGGQYLCTAKFVRTNGGTALYSAVGITDSNSSYIESGFVAAGTETIIAEEIQLEDVTAQTTQTAGEYVSVGVTSAPYYHGSFVDGVKCFPTDLSGNPLTTMERYKPELAATNLCLQSNAFTTAPWSVIGTPAATQNVVGPDGATSAWTLTDNDAGAIEGVFMPAASLTLTAATWTFSGFVKKTTGAQTSYPVVSIDNGSLIAIATIDTTNGVATAWTAYTAFTIATGLTARCRSFNADYWRVEISFTATAVGWTLAIYPAGATTATKSTGVVEVSATGSAVFYGAQLELGSFASSDIATTTTAVTRNADILTYTGGDVPNLKTLCATFKREVGVSVAAHFLNLSDGTANNIHQHYTNSATQSGMAGVTGGVVEWGGNTSNAYVPGTTGKMASTFGTNIGLSSFNGVAQTAGTPPITAPVVDRLGVGYYPPTGLLQTNGNVGPIYGWTRNLSQSELNAVTA